MASHRARIMLLVAFTVPWTGCAGWNWRGRGLDDDSARVGAALGARHAPGGQGAGLDQRALDIEQHLGFDRE